MCFEPKSRRRKRDWFEPVKFSVSRVCRSRSTHVTYAMHVRCQLCGESVGISIIFIGRQHVQHCCIDLSVCRVHVLYRIETSIVRPTLSNFLSHNDLVFPAYADKTSLRNPDGVTTHPLRLRMALNTNGVYKFRDFRPTFSYRLVGNDTR